MHYIIVIALIVVIIILQIRSYQNTRNKINSYKEIFPSYDSDYRIKNVLVEATDESDCEPEEDYESLDVGGIEVSQLVVESTSPVMERIVTALNNYLAKNKGAASDFHLMKDVVERYCDAEEEEITTQQPIPLYLGLMGTMVGIIVGIGAIAISGGLAGGSLMNHISELMTCVAIAMAASFTGVLCTTLIAWRSKDAVSKVQADKNRFYSWVQTELLPVLSGDAVNAIFLLQQNLMSFNQTFKTNVAGLDTALSRISDASKEQTELIKLIRDIDILQVAQANIKVLKELKDCTSEMTVFNQYLHNVSGYLAAVNALNNNINEHLNRTAAIERMGAFFESEIAQVSAREQYINQVVAKVDDTLKRTFEALSENISSGVVELRSKAAEEYSELSTSWTAQQDAFKTSLTEQQVMMQEILKQREKDFTDYLVRQEAALAEKASAISSIAKEIQMLADTKTAMNDLVSSTRDQNRKLDLLIDSLAAKTDVVTMKDNLKSYNHKDWFSALLKWGSLICIVLIILAFGMFTYSFVNDLNSDDVKDTASFQYMEVTETENPMKTIGSVNVNRDTVIFQTE